MPFFDALAAPRLQRRLGQQLRVRLSTLAIEALPVNAGRGANTQSDVSAEALRILRQRPKSELGRLAAFHCPCEVWSEQLPIYCGAATLLTRAPEGALYSHIDVSDFKNAAHETVHECQVRFTPGVECRWKSTLSTETRESATARDLHTGLRMRSPQRGCRFMLWEFRVLVMLRWWCCMKFARSLPPSFTLRCDPTCGQREVASDLPETESASEVLEASLGGISGGLPRVHAKSCTTGAGATSMPMETRSPSSRCQFLSLVGRRVLCAGAKLVWANTHCDIAQACGTL